MFNDEQCAAEQPRSTGARIGVGIGGGNLAPKQIGEPSVMQLAEAEFTCLEQMKQEVSKLEERLECVCTNFPENTTEEAKRPEPNMDRPDGRLHVIIEQTARLLHRIERINSRLNI